MEITPQSVYADAILTYGVRAQEDMLHEEVGELLSALNKHARGRIQREAVITEIADVIIMCEQLATILGRDEVDKEIDFKLERICKRYNEWKEKNGGNKG